MCVISRQGAKTAKKEPPTENRQPRTANCFPTAKHANHAKTAFCHSAQVQKADNRVLAPLSLVTSRLSLLPYGPGALLSSNKVCCPEWRSVKAVLAGANRVFEVRNRDLQYARPLNGPPFYGVPGITHPEFPQGVIGVLVVVGRTPNPPCNSLVVNTSTRGGGL